MVARDRTREFLEVAEHFKKSGLVVPKAINAPLRAGDSGRDESSTPSSAAFRALAAEIGQALEATTTKLTKLTKLAQKKSLFDDPTAEINRLTGSIKGDIQSLNNGLEELAKLKHTGAVAINKQSDAHAGTVVDSLKSRLMDTTREFQGVLQVRSGNVRAQSERRREFSSARGPGGGGGSSGAGGSHQGMTRRHAASPSSSNGEVRLEVGPVAGQQEQSQMVLQRDNYYESRADAVETIESTIVELGGIFNQLATMVSEQGEMVERIDENIADADRNVTRAHDQLLQYMESVSSNRGLMLKIFGILIVFIMTFVMVS